MNTLVRTPASIAWLVLIVLTVVAWLLGTDHGFGPNGHTAAAIVILAVAVFKVRLVGVYFMDLREAPAALRLGFEGYCVLLFGVITGMFLWA